jgi:LysR family cys regulon transcriptional activator
VRDEAADAELVARPAGYLFGPNVARVAFRRGAYLRHFVYTFAELLSERLNRTLIQHAMSGGIGNDYQM